MIQIREYNFENLNTDKFDRKIIGSLEKLEGTGKFKHFFKQLNKVIESDANFSFIKASNKVISKLKKINTHINIERLDVVAYKKDVIHKEYYTLNDILEIIFGYHLYARLQLLKEYFKALGFDNCVYCLAQYTTAYTSKNRKLYIKGNLDHIHPKSINALISLSLNNLVPVCAHCNQRKLDADFSKFNFNPFFSTYSPVFIFQEVITIDNGSIAFNDIRKLKLDNVNPSLEKRLELTALYKEYRSPLINLLDRYNKFNSIFYGQKLNEVLGVGISDKLEYFISETPYTDETIQNIPLHKFKSDFYKELENYKKIGVLKFS